VTDAEFGPAPDREPEPEPTARSDRRRLLREYKETALPAGVWAVRNLNSGKVLLGKSANLPGMLNRQRFQLEMGGHPVRELQSDWNALGPDAFAFEVLDTVDSADDPTYDPAEDLAALLEMWLERLALPAEKVYRR
jgi:hypothetical protein